MASQKIGSKAVTASTCRDLGRRDRALRPGAPGEPTIVAFLALPEDASADIAPRAARARRARLRLVGGLPAARRQRPRALVSRRRGAARRARPTAWPSATTAALQGAQLVACAGCYPTAAVLALAPLVTGGARRRPTSSSTPSPASRAPARRRPSGTHFCESRRQPVGLRRASRTGTRAEIEQELGAPVTFVPHLVPLDRGILETIYVRVPAGHDRGDVADASARAPTPTRRSCG